MDKSSPSGSGTRLQDLPVLDGVGIMPQAEGAPEPGPIPASELPGEFQPKQPPVDPVLVQRAAEEIDLGRHLLLLRVFGLMVGALLITAGVAWWVSSAAELPQSFGLRLAYVKVLFIFELASVIYLTRIVPRLNATMAGIVLLIYAAFNGVSFSIFAPFVSVGAIAYGFLLTALTFAAMFVYGHRTKMDLGRILAWTYMLGIGVVLVSLGRFFFVTPVSHVATAVIGILFFSNLIAYHANDIEDMYMEFDDDPQGWKAAFCGALLLYLDFVNLYILIVSALARARSTVYSKD